jgi:hypothetical protein
VVYNKKNKIQNFSTLKLHIFCYFQTKNVGMKTTQTKIDDEGNNAKLVQRNWTFPVYFANNSLPAIPTLPPSRRFVYHNGAVTPNDTNESKCADMAKRCQGLAE